MRKLLALTVVLFSQHSLALLAQDGLAQGHADIGPTIVLGGSGQFGIGGRLGLALAPVGTNGDVLGLQASVDRYQFETHIPGRLFDHTQGYALTTMSGQINYHFSTRGGKLVPHVGAGLGYQRVSYECVTAQGFGCIDEPKHITGTFVIGRAGVRYFWRPTAALYAEAGVGGPAMNVGVIFKVR